MNMLKHMIFDNEMILYLFTLLTFSMIVDWISGTIVAYITKQADSKIGTNGILRKCLIFITTITIMACGILIPQGEAFITVTLFGLVVMQLQSIVENCQKLDLKEVKFLQKLITMMKKEEGDK